MSRDGHVLLCDVTALALHGNGPPAYIENTVPVLLAACVLRALSSNRRCLQIHCLATRIHATVCLAAWSSWGEEVALLWAHHLMTTGGVTLSDVFSSVHGPGLSPSGCQLAVHAPRRSLQAALSSWGGGHFITVSSYAI
jgi:hypothetical protein